MITPSHTGRSLSLPWFPPRPSTVRRHLLIVILSLVSCFPSPVFTATQGGFCFPPALGSPCATGSSTSPGNSRPLPGLGLGNPTHLGSGNKYQLDIDLPANPSAPGLELIRHYNGLSTQGDVLGRNWTLSYDTRLQRQGKQWWLRLADGGRRPISAPIPEGTGFQWRWPDGRKLHFDANGHLSRISMHALTLVRIERHAGPHQLAGRIKRVENHNGHALAFHYSQREGQPLLESIDTPRGRFRYHYRTPPPASLHSAWRLESVLRPDGMQRIYHYESDLQAGNPYALTGISIQPAGGDSQRLSTWRYDRHGRVIAMQRHGQSLPALSIEYVQMADGSQPGLTRVRSSNGQQQDFYFDRAGGDYQLLQDRERLEYDQLGGLKAIGSLLRMQESEQRESILMAPRQAGWPELIFQYQRKPPSLAWQSRDIGMTKLGADAAGRPSLLRYANGDSLQLHYNLQGRVVELNERAGVSGRKRKVRLQWHGRRLLRIEHPAETEIRHHDAGGRVTTRTVRRPASEFSPPANFKESLHYDGRGQLRRHELPEGGVLHYEWHGAGPHTKLLAVRWEDKAGHIQPVITSSMGMPGYSYGNGLSLVTGSQGGLHADTLLLEADGQTWWRQHRAYDGTGSLRLDHHEFPTLGHHDRYHYVHDGGSRLQAAWHHDSGGTLMWWYAWNDDGSLAALRHEDNTLRPDIQRDASGLPTAVGRFTLGYGPGRRLETVSTASAPTAVAQYRHNAAGHRILKQHAGVTTHYLYLDDRLVAEADVLSNSGMVRVSRRYVYAGAAPVGMIEYPLGAPPQLYAVHADLSGAPRLVTDARQQVRWLASYTPTGQASRVAGDLDFPLRLPGQYEDAETGWHDNLLRSYAPELGQYLEPDPLGPVPGTDTFGYAGQQPWRYADPYGLLLFAFDGTRYDADSLGNVQKLAQAYRDGAAHYHSGPGNSFFLDWDAVVAWRAGRILENQWQALLSTLEHQPKASTVPIDIIGFSRGAALARHFGNHIAAHTRNGMFSINDPMRGPISACVDLRFMGLFDTVAQFGVAGSHNHQYDFGISELWSWVSHAVALHEHRWAFPLTSADTGGTGNVVEAPFVGAHADIGGGLALLSPTSPMEEAPDTLPPQAEEPDLAKVALAWMHWQALAANVDFADLEARDTVVQTPLLRDLRSPLLRTIQRGDRAVYAASGARQWAYQHDAPRLGKDSRIQVESFIDRPDLWRSQAGEQVGTVDMAGYARWLEETLGWAPD